jgi:tight adherence protein G
MVSLFNKQEGHAAILFVMMVPVLFGVFVLGTDGARAMQDRARLDDALEAASLAIAAHNDSNKEPEPDPDSPEPRIGAGSDVNHKIATVYIQQYMNDLDDIKSIDVEKKECIPSETDTSADNYCKDSGNSSGRFFQYTVTAQTKHSTWFGIDDTALDGEFNVASRSVARKYQNEAVDVVFVSDFSGSMLQSWNGTLKYLGLINTIKSVTDELQKYNDDTLIKSTVSFVGFSSYVSSLSSVESISRVLPINTTRNIYKYTICQRSELKGDDHRTVNDIFNEKNDCTEKSRVVYPNDYESYIYNTDRYGSLTCYYAFEPERGWRHYSKEYVKNNCYRDGNYIGYRYTVLYTDDRNDSFFYELEPTSDFSIFNNKISEFYPEMGTASYEGLIRGAQMADKGSNVKRLIIILSDGEDNNTWKTQNLVDAGMCTEITSHLDSLTVDTNNDGNRESVESKIVLIGFDYTVSDNVALQTCVGSDNVFQAEDFGDIRDQILQLIVEEIGHLK